MSLAELVHTFSAHTGVYPTLDFNRTASQMAFVKILHISGKYLNIFYSIAIAESALRLRKSSYTVIEQLRFIKHLRLGDFHLNMAKITKDIPALMPNPTCIDDEGTLAFFKTLLGKKISNKPSQIKKAQNFQESQDFIDSIGIEALKVALESFAEECQDSGVNYQKTDTGANKFLEDFLEKKNINLWYSFKSEQSYFDNDMLNYGIDLITRVILDLAANQGIREGDAVFLKVYHKIMVLYMLNFKDEQVSYYCL